MAQATISQHQEGHRNIGRDCEEEEFYRIEIVLSGIFTKVFNDSLGIKTESLCQKISTIRTYINLLQKRCILIVLCNFIK